SSRKHLDALIEQLQWLESLPDCDQMLAGVPTTKVKHMADVAAALDAGDMKDLRPAKRHALILALIYQMRVRARDDIAEMFIRRISAIHKTAREELVEIQKRQRELSEHLVATLDDVLEILGENLDDATTGARVRELLAPHGDLNRLREDCAAIRVWSGSNHLPLVWKPFSSHRAVMFRMAQALRFEAPGP
ncbi:Tn3 family transposase, partial [Vibrio parahaemolyticus]|nr:Tn3 family transposase [Vibrio parahaemolyticus]